MKTIARHKAVQEILNAEDEGFIDYKYNVWLRAEYRFTRGRMAGCREGNFNSVKDFLEARPERIEG